MSSPNSNSVLNCPFLVINGKPVQCETCPLVNMQGRFCGWRKIKEAYEKRRKEEAGITPKYHYEGSFTITQSGSMDSIKVYTIPALQEILEQAKCFRCGRSFGARDLKMYPHPDGYWVQGIQLKQWVYARCEHCKLDTALWKILQSLGRDR